jgi:8-oxo-dGTP diphosphatase
MSGLQKPCPHCGKTLTVYANPVPTVDVIIATKQGIVLIERKNPPLGWALPGGFVDYGETVEHAAIREAREETGLDVELTGLLGVYSHPSRDPRQHTISVVYTARTKNARDMQAGDDAGTVRVFPKESLPGQLAFDHQRILNDYFSG